MLELTNRNPTDKGARQSNGSPSLNGYLKKQVPPYAFLFFDHLYSEYLTISAGIHKPEVRALLDEIHQRRTRDDLAWSDIYTFDLALVDFRPLENLIRKAYDARAKYRSIAGQKEYDEYLASKPPDLTTILIAPQPEPGQPHAVQPDLVQEQQQQNQPPAQVSAHQADIAGQAAVSTQVIAPNGNAETAEQQKPTALIERVLRADIKYLLSKFYLYYAMLPEREDLREYLTTRAVRLTLLVLGIIVVLILLSVGGFAAYEKISGSKSGIVQLFTSNQVWGAFGPTVGAVAFAGIVGGCVSMLQRIQSAPSEGDALFNLASLTSGWRGLSLSPLYGGIFACLLFVLFAAGILEGTIFPDINTPGKNRSIPAAERVAPESKTAGVTNPQGTQPVQAPLQAENPTPTPTPVTETEKTGILHGTEFLSLTGPTDGVAFALLIIWSFIAGFAERLVPDTLNRLVAKNEAIQGTNV